MQNQHRTRLDSLPSGFGICILNLIDGISLTLGLEIPEAIVPEPDIFYHLNSEYKSN